MAASNKRGAVGVAIRILDVLLVPVTLVGAFWLSVARRFGIHRLPVTRRVLYAVGVFPIRDHYYEPLFKPERLRHPLSQPRHLPGVDLDEPAQMALLAKFTYGGELAAFPRERPAGDIGYHYANGSFESGDAECLYSMLRHFKPKRFIEIGSGYSTLIAREAIRRNAAEDASNGCEIICVEPYEQPWLESLGVQVIRCPVEQVDPALFARLGSGDVLFIDSSHMVRPQGDVLFEFLELLPQLPVGVLVHVHDVFTPRDYPPEWVVDDVRFWNEQYVMEAFLTLNRDFRVLMALNHMRHVAPDEVAAAFPVLGAELGAREPGSFWMVRTAA
jgi:hypothetical protein